MFNRFIFSVLNIVFIDFKKEENFVNFSIHEDFFKNLLNPFSLKVTEPIEKLLYDIIL